MTGRIIHLNEDEHRQAQLNLPWYVNGRLDPDERSRLEAHLSRCVQCQQDLEAERLLGAQAANLPLNADGGWMKLRPSLTQRAPRPSPPAPFWRGRWQGWAIAAQLLLLVIISATLVLSRQEGAQYRALSAASEPNRGNVLVMFRPDTPERALRSLLRSADAQVVDGPTETGVYVLHVPDAARTGLLKGFAQRPEIVLAQPVDGGLSQ